MVSVSSCSHFLTFWKMSCIFSITSWSAALRFFILALSLRFDIATSNNILELAVLFDWPIDDFPKLRADKLLKLSQLKISSEIDDFHGEVPVNATG